MMKCEHCGRNDATVYYRGAVNGRAMEAHLCAECALRLGLVGGEELFSLLAGGGAEELPAAILTPAARRALRVQEPEKPLLSEEETRRLREERRRNALELQLREALETEDFERAAVLRDRLNRQDGPASTEGAMKDE